MLASINHARLHGHRHNIANRLVVCLLNHQRGFSTFQDETLQWAQENRELAQRCLELPPLNDEKAPDLKLEKPLKSFEDYWKWRNWDFSCIHEQKDLFKAQALTTHVLSAPLTVATQLLLPGPHGVNSPRRRKKRRRLNYCCIGARAEAQLPQQYWKELLVLSEASGQTIDCRLDFVGPEILRRPKVRLFHGNSSMTLRWPFNGKLHDYLAQEEEDQLLVSHWDAFILFNPGMGHENLQKEWKPTVDLLLDAFQTPRRPLLLTAHSALDAVREANVLCNYLLETAPLYVENPFASRIKYQDPFDDRHIVRPNHYVYGIRD